LRDRALEWIERWRPAIVVMEGREQVAET